MGTTNNVETVATTSPPITARPRKAAGPSLLRNDFASVDPEFGLRPQG